MIDGADRGLRTVLHIKLAQNCLHMNFHGRFANIETASDHLVGVTHNEASQSSDLAFGKKVRKVTFGLCPVGCCQGEVRQLFDQLSRNNFLTTRCQLKAVNEGLARDFLEDITVRAGFEHVHEAIDFETFVQDD